MPPRSLVEMCMRIAINNVHLITSVANMPDYARHQILQSIKSAAALSDLEESDEGLFQETEPYWKKLIGRDFAHLKRKGVEFTPTIRDHWSTAYAQYKEVDDIQKHEAEEKLKASMLSLSSQASGRTAKILSGQAATALASKIKKTSHWSASAPSGFRGDSVRKGANAFDKAKREAKQLSKTRAALFSSAPKTVLKAPAHMIDAKRIARQPEIPKIRPVRPVLLKETEIERQGFAARESEARLLAIKNQVSNSKKNKPQQRPPPPRPQPKATNHFDFDKDDDDLFGDKDFAASSPESASSPPSHSDSPGSSLKRKRGILSNAPGANSRHLGGRAGSPPKSTAQGVFMRPTPKTTDEPAIKRQRKA